MSTAKYWIGLSDDEAFIEIDGFIDDAETIPDNIQRWLSKKGVTVVENYSFDWTQKQPERWLNRVAPPTNSDEALVQTAEFVKWIAETW